MYKSSQFNILVPTPDNGIVIRNLFSQKYLHVPEPMRDKVIEYLDMSTCAHTDLESTYINRLVQGGFLVPYDEEESAKVDSFRKDIAQATDQLDITILPTDDCNFRCAYCFEYERHSYMSHDTAESIVKYFEKNFSRYRKVYIQWFGGEPLLCKDTIHYIMTNAIRIAKRERVSLIAGITTNGYELDVETYKMLCANRISWIQISVDGTRDIHNFQRPHKCNHDSYTRIVNNLKAIRDQVPAGMCKIYYRVTISKQILQRIDEVLQFYKQEFAYDNRFRLSLQPIMDWGGDRVGNILDELPSVEDTVGCLKKAAMYGLMPIGHHTQAASGVVCEAMRVNGFVVGPDNTVHKCPMAMYANTDSCVNKGVIGHLSQEGDMHLNTANNNAWCEGSPYKGELCYKCRYYAICHGNVTCPYSMKFSNEKKNLCRKSIYDEYVPAETMMMYLLGKVKDEL